MDKRSSIAIFLTLIYSFVVLGLVFQHHHVNEGHCHSISHLHQAHSSHHHHSTGHHHHHFENQLNDHSRHGHSDLFDIIAHLLHCSDRGNFSVEHGGFAFLSRSAKTRINSRLIVASDRFVDWLNEIPNQFDNSDRVSISEKFSSFNYRVPQFAHISQRSRAGYLAQFSWRGPPFII